MISFRALSKGIPALALSLALAAPGASKAANMVTNGSFETNGGVGQFDYQTSATGWTSPGNSYNFLFDANATSSGAPGQYGTVALWDNTNNSGAGGAAITVPDGYYFVGADGNFQTGAITQQITGLTVNQQYYVSFDWAASQQNNRTGDTTSQFQVSLGGDSQYTSVYNLPSHTFSGWMHETMVFTASATSETLSFLAIGANADGSTATLPPFALLDGVSMEAVPEPASMALMGIGMAGATLFARLRRRNRTA